MMETTGNLQYVPGHALSVKSARALQLKRIYVTMKVRASAGGVFVRGAMDWQPADGRFLNSGGWCVDFRVDFQACIKTGRSI